MRYVVIAGGPNIRYSRLTQFLSNDDYILCADSGALHARNMKLVPSKVIGDLDSIDSETLQWVRDLKVPLEVYPVAKDMTDTELCLRSISVQQTTYIICSFTGRPDHVLSNYLLAGKLAAEGRKIIMTDGLSYVYPIAGPYKLTLPVEKIAADDTAKDYSVSLLPLFSNALGVTTEGLAYPLSDATLIPGSTFSVSNKAMGNSREFSVCLESGILLVMITPEV